jgi:cytoskeletal protein CcmA (bactofilin family)
MLLCFAYIPAAYVLPLMLLGFQGDLVIGKTGSVTGDIMDMGVVVNDGGKIVGNVSVERLELRGKVGIKRMHR